VTTGAAAANGRTEPSPTSSEWAWTIVRGAGPVVATAIHDGHQVRSEVAPWLALSASARLREEDPSTGQWVTLAPTQIVVHRSRFEVDMNRSVEQAVYLTPEQAWGLEVWKRDGPPSEVVRGSRELHAAFYTQLRAVLQEVVARHGRFVLYDLHSYNHRRAGPTAPPEDGRKSPEINLGTGTMDRSRWTPVVEAFMESLASVEVLGRRLDVRENVRFKGGYLPSWVHQTFPETGCALAVEVKKFFMDEWTGEVEPVRLRAVGAALASTVPAVQSALESM
jgi:N-formylglutamate deformylase